MAQLREINRRRKSINNTAKVTHAMELVSAAKMKKSQEAALASRPYNAALNQILQEVRTKSASQHVLLTAKEAPSQMLILITSDRGLVGGLNMNLFREIARLASTSAHSRSELSGNQAHFGSVAGFRNFKFVVVGKKGQSFATKSSADMVSSFISDEQEPLDLARTLTKITTDAFKAGEVASVRIIYPDFLSTIKQVPAITQILPIDLDETQQAHSRSELSGNQAHFGSVASSETDLLFEPSADQILENILPHYVLTKIYQTLLEAKASEHSARMVAMKNATDAAKDLVEDLTLTYNQARQEAITKELLDIVTAQSAFA